jgi:uncharacterized delta-60 repeat protein
VPTLSTVEFGRNSSGEGVDPSDERRGKLLVPGRFLMLMTTSRRLRCFFQLLLAALALLGLAAPFACARSGVRPDPTFGSDGRVTTSLPPEGDGPWFARITNLMLSQGDRPVVATSRSVLRYLPNGKPDPTFSGDGVVAVEPPTPGEFELSDAEVDAADRIVLAGTWTETPPQTNPPSCAPACPTPTGRRLALFFRYLPDGSPDPGFGNDGVVLTDFGLPAASDPTGSGVADSAEIYLGKVRLDAAGDVLVSGGYLAGYVHCKLDIPVGFEVGFLARLAPSGMLDPGFGSGGILALPELSSVQIMWAVPGRGWQLSATRDRSCGTGHGVAVRVTSAGHLSSSFGSNGVRPIRSYESGVDSALAPGGRTVVLGPTGGSGGAILPQVHRRHARATVYRLGPDGEPDRSFGRDGEVPLHLPAVGSQLNAIASDSDGHVYLAGRELQNYGHPARERNTFLLGRLTPSGALDRRFGRAGWVSAGFGSDSSAAASGILIDRSGRRLLLGGDLASSLLSTRQGIALVRYAGLLGGR